jgi:hypothetical protein
LSTPQVFVLSFEPRYNRGKDAEKWTLKNQIFDNFDEAPKLFKKIASI